MCGFGIGTIFAVAIFVIAVLVVIAIIRAAFPGVFSGWAAPPFGNIISIVIYGVVAILILLFLWRVAECAGLIGGHL